MRLGRKSWTRAHAVAALTLPCLAALSALSSIEPGGTAQAQPGPPQAPTVQCNLRGQVVLSASTTIVDAQGQAIARFSGAPTPLVASDFPADAQGRARVETGFGAGAFRIRGFLALSELPLFTATNVAIAPGHLWLAEGRSVTLVGAAAGRLRVEKKLLSPFQQSVRAEGACTAFSLEPQIPSGFSPAAGVRGYQLKHESLELYGDPASDAPLATLHRAPSVDAVLFYGSEQQNGSVHLHYHGEIVVDAWAKLSALSPLPAGELIDQVAPAITQHNAPQLTFQTPPKLVRPTREVPLRRAAKESDPKIGVIEPGAETYVLDQVAGWANVLPKSMNVMPAAAGQFWAKSSDLGL